MKTPIALLSLLNALALAGCASVSAIAPVTVPVKANGEPAPAFVVLQAAPVGTTFTASSEANGTFYAATNATDGVQTSAWRPAADDALPTLRFDLPSPILLSGLGIKLSLGRDATPASNRVYVAVETSNDGVSWSTLAMGLQPSETVFETLDLTDRSASHVRVSFVASGADDLDDLLVCEVQLVEGTPPVSNPGAPGGDSDLPGDDPASPGEDPIDSGNNGKKGNKGNNGGNGGNTTEGGNRGVGQGGGGGNGTSNEGNGSAT